MLARWVGWDDRLDAALDQPVAQLSGVVGPIGEQTLGRRGAAQQLGGADQVVGVAGGDDQRPGAALVVGQGVDLGGATAAGSADGIGEGPPFAPAAERCALT